MPATPGHGHTQYTIQGTNGIDKMQSAATSEASPDLKATYETIKVIPQAGAMGAEICNADLSEPLEERVFKEIRRAWLKHHVIYFRDQELTPLQQDSCHLIIIIFYLQIF